MRRCDGCSTTSAGATATPCERSLFADLTAGTDVSVAPYRKIAAKCLGRSLRLGEIVHHVNGDHSDNRPENLQVLPSHSAHVRLHREQDGMVTNQHGTFPILRDPDARRANLREVNARRREYRREWKKRQRAQKAQA